MDLRLLERFLSVIEHGSFNRAAQKLHISQPALSKSIQSLESLYGVQLITRTPRGVTATSFGESIYAHAKLITSGVEHLGQEISAMRDLTLGTVNLGTSPGAAFTNNVLARAILRLSKKGRRLIINSRVGPRELLVKPLLAGELDFVITVLADEAPEQLVQQELYRDPLLFVVGRKHPLAGKKAVNIGDLAGFPWIVPDEPAHQNLSRLAEKAGSPLQHTVLRCNASNLIKALVIGSDFVALMREDMAHLDLQSGDYLRLALSPRLKSNTLLETQRMGLVYRAHSAPSRASDALMTEIRSFYKH